MEKTEDLNQINIVVGDLNWDKSRKYDEEFDLDISAFLLNKDRKLDSDKNFIFYNNIENKNESIKYTGDNITGDKAEDEELIIVNLDDIPDDINIISIVASIHELENEDYYFKDIKNSNLKIFKAKDEFDLLGKMIFKFDLEKEFGETKAIIALDIIKNGKEWEYIPQSKSFKGGLVEIIKLYGGNI